MTKSINRNILGPKADIKKILDRLEIEKSADRLVTKKEGKINRSQKIKPKYGYTPYSADYKNYSMFPFSWNIQLLREEHDNGKWPHQPLFTRDDGSKIVRPLSLKETIEAKVGDYNILTLPDGRRREEWMRFELFNSWLDTCTGIAYKSDSTKFKIIPICREIIEIDKDFCDQFIVLDYENVEGIELDLKLGKYNHLLTEKDVLEHPVWIEAVEGDVSLLREYVKIVFKNKQNYQHYMRVSFNKLGNSNPDSLWPVIISAHYPISDLRSDLEVPTSGFMEGARFVKLKSLRRKK